MRCCSFLRERGRDCSSLKNVKLGNWVVLLRSYAFAGCTALETIELPLTLAEDEILVADLCSKENPDRAFYKHGDLNIVPAEGAVDMYADDGEVVLSARDYVHAVELCGEAVFSDNGFSMKKGEVKRIEVRFLPDSANTKITIEAYTHKAFI